MNPMQLDQTSGLDAEKSPRVVVSILNWNGWQDTLECLESVRKLDYPNYLTVVVDNGSWDDSAERMKAWAHENLGAGQVLADYTQEIALQGGDQQTEEALESVPSPARLVLIRNEENLGFTGGNNVAFHYALTGEHPADFVFLLNNDATVDVQPGDTVYDVGGHVGVYSILLAKAVGPRGTVIAFDLHHETYEQLLENLRLNGLKNVRAFEKALTERARGEKLYIAEVIANFSLLPGAIAGSKGTDMPFERVQVVRGDEFVEAERLPVPKSRKSRCGGF